MFRLIKVCGDSLTPEFSDGDFVLVSKIPIIFRRLSPGDTVAFRHPRYGALIKKVNAISPDGGELMVFGVHPESIDSRCFGPVRSETVIGKVIAHIRKPSGR